MALIIHTHTHSADNPVIQIDQKDLMEQAANIGTPITDFITSPAFAEVAPAGLVTPPSGNSGAANVFLTITSLTLMLLTSIVVI